MAQDKKHQHSSPSLTNLMPWIVWGLGCLFYFYECLLQVSPSVMSSELMRDFAVTGQTLGLLSGIYFYSYAAMQLPGGVLMDYFGPQRLLTIATLICALSTMAFGMTDNFYTACLARLMIGLGSSFAAAGAMKLATNWFGASHFALLTGLMVTIGMLGAIGGEAPLGYLVDTWGWRSSMNIMGVVGIFIAILLLLVAKDAPKKPIQDPLPQQHEEKLLPSLMALLKKSQLWLVAFYGGLMYLSTPVFCGLWGVPYLMLKMGVSKTTAANFISMVFVGWVIASPLWGILSNRIGKRKPPLYVGAIGAFITSLLFIYAPIENNWVLEILLLLFGVFSAGFLPAFAVAKELCPRNHVATGLSFMNMMNMIGIALVQPLIGFILDRLWEGTIVDSVRLYPLYAYHAALAILPIGIFISLLILPKIKETYCQNQA